MAGMVECGLGWIGLKIKLSFLKGNNICRQEFSFLVLKSFQKRETAHSVKDLLSQGAVSFHLSSPQWKEFHLYFP